VGRPTVGLVGKVVHRIRGGDLPGEVRVVQDGLPHVYIAFSAAPIPLGGEVLIIADRGSRQVDVEPWPLTGAASRTPEVSPNARERQ
jgi:hypothetical protein